MRRGKRKITFLIASLLILGLAIIFGFGNLSANYALESPNHSIQTTYETGAKISGWINIQFLNESNSSLFKDSAGNSITLIDILNKNPDYNYSVNATYGTIESSKAQHLNISDIFLVPTSTGQIMYQINLSNQELFSEQITISPETNLNSSILEKMNRLIALKKQIETFDSLEQKSINTSLNMSHLESELNQISADYLNASTQAELDNLSARLSLIKIPEKIEITKTGVALPLFPKSEDINLEVIKNITNSDYESNKTDEYKNAILGWNFHNINSKVNFKEFTANYGKENQFLTNVFELQIKETKSLNYSLYLFLKKMDNTILEQNYQEKDGYDIIEINSSSQKIDFSTTEKINFTNIPFFISPSLTKLSINDFSYVQIKRNEKKKYEEKKWTTFALVILLLLLVGLAAYLVLETWYKKKYEDYLFKDKNELYNLAVYINSSKRKGIKDSEIIQTLKRARWNSEQIRYAMKKYSGKRTGMREIPLIQKRYNINTA